MTRERSILVVDDDKEMVEEVSHLLTDAGYSVTAANDGIKGDELLSANTYDLVMLDLKMPGMDGFTVLKRLKERNSAAKAIVVTARPLYCDLMDGPEAVSDEENDILNMAEAIVIKPYDVEAMLNLIKSLTDKSET